MVISTMIEPKTISAYYMQIKINHINYYFEAGDGVHIRHIENVELPNDGSGLGFGIVGSRNSGVVIKTILDGGVADKVS